MKDKPSTKKKMDFIDQLISLTPQEIDQMMKAEAKPAKKVRLYHLVNKRKYPTYESSKNSGSIFYSCKIL